MGIAPPPTFGISRVMVKLKYLVDAMNSSFMTDSIGVSRGNHRAGNLSAQDWALVPSWGSSSLFPLDWLAN